jgi:thioredoxin-like negative regulator of GroEL
LKVVKVNVDDLSEVASRYQVRGIPTLLLLRDRQTVARRVGALGDRALRSWLDSQLVTAGSRR